MSANPFENPPKARFVFRLILPGAAVLFVGAVMVGLIARDASVKPRAPATEQPRKPAPGLLGPTQDFYRALALEWAHVPDTCWNGAESEFNKGRCQETWVHLAKSSAVGLLPLGALVAFLLFALDSLSLTYRRIRKRIGESQYLVKATVTRPARVWGDLYGWFYCLHCISVELQDKTQLKVYLSPHENIPFPGDTVAVFKLGSFLGRRRYMATLYAPHVAVFAAIRAK